MTFLKDKEMTMNRSTFITIFAALVVGFLLNSFFIVNEKEKAIVFQFGEAVRTDIGCLLYTSPSPRDRG